MTNIIPVLQNADATACAIIHALIPDFGDRLDAAHFESRMTGADPLYLAAFIGNTPAGYLTAYDRYRDGSYYCWMAGTVPAQRGRGVLTALMAKLEEEARKRDYGSIRIKTRYKWQAMRRWLDSHDYVITKVDNRTPIEDSRIHLIKTL